MHKLYDELEIRPHVSAKAKAVKSQPASQEDLIVIADVVVTLWASFNDVDVLPARIRELAELATDCPKDFISP